MVVERFPLPKQRRRRVLARSLVALSVLLLVAAVTVAGYPFYTDWRAGSMQEDLSGRLDSDSLKDKYQRNALADGDPLTRIVIAKIGLDYVVVEGTSSKALNTGAGHYRGTPLPGDVGNVAIAGHSGMNGKPFSKVHRLKPGDDIKLITPFAEHTYKLVKPFGKHGNPWVTQPDDWGVVSQSQEHLLTLTTCYPSGSAKQRMIVRAKLIESKPLS